MDSFDTAGGDSEIEGFIELGDKNFLSLEVGKAPSVATRVELGSASPVGIGPAHL